MTFELYETRRRERDNCGAFHPSRGVGCLLDKGHSADHRNWGTRPHYTWPRGATGQVIDRKWHPALVRRIERHSVVR